MRKVLLATSALALVCAGSAMAADSQSVTVSAEVSATCSMTDPDDVDFGTDPLVGATLFSDFEFTCNFAGDGGEGPGGLEITFASANGGLENINDTSVRSYSIDYNGNGEVLASALPASFGDSSTAAGVANPRTFAVQLEEALPVAGAYDDVLTVSIAP